MTKLPTVINKMADVLAKIEELFPLFSNEDKKQLTNYTPWPWIGA